MKKFMVFYVAPVSAEEHMQGHSEEMKGIMDQWMTWTQKVGSALKDMGTPLGVGVKVSKDGETPADSHVVGYSMLEAQSLEDAKEMVKGHPHLMMPEGEIEVHECLPIPGME